MQPNMLKLNILLRKTSKMCIITAVILTLKRNFTKNANDNESETKQGQK